MYRSLAGFCLALVLPAAAEPGAGAPSSNAAPPALPLKQVVLFTSGVACFERSAEIAGPLTADLEFTPDQMADLIKSLVLVDPGGAPVRAVTYESRDPIERTLQSFAVDLTDNPDLAALLNRLRGTPVRITTGSGDWTGRLIGVEVRTQQVERTTIREPVMTLLTDGALRALPLDGMQAITVLDPAIRSDLEAALGVLGESRARDRKRVRVSFTGDARRTVRAAYMLEAPVWKTSYRLVLDGPQALLQGWAHIENLTDEDWTGVSLTLVSGQPLSFIQNLYDPLYLRRPVVRAVLEALAAPPVYAAALEEAPADAAKVEAGGMPGGRNESKRLRMARGVVGAAAMAVPPAPPGIELEDLAQGGVQAMAAAGQAGELFEFRLSEPLDLARRQSAMIPIVNRPLAAEGLSIFNAQVNPMRPLNGIAFTNSLDLFLMQGPVTVFEGGLYAGDARLGDTPRGAARLLSYAVDLACEGALDGQPEADEIVSLKIVRGTLTLKRRFAAESRYRLKSSRDAARRVVIEHPIRPEWTLVQPERDVEKTRDLYRHSLVLEPGQAREIVFREERLDQELLILSNLETEQVRLFLKQKGLSDRLRQALQEVVAKQDSLAAVRRDLAQKEAALKTLAEEQGRIRENMRTVARNSESYAMWERKLVQQEEAIDRLHQAIETLRAAEAAQADALARFLASLDVE